MDNIIKMLLGMFQPKASAPTRVSPEGLEHIKEWEQLRLKAYLPTVNDVWTIGWGHTSTAEEGMIITEKQAEKLLRQDLAWVRKAIKDLVKVPLNQNQYDALASFIFNIGRPNFANSTMLKKLNAGNFKGASREFPRWRYQKGQELAGLVRRRRSERKTFDKEIA